jgi:hypothetical protein
MLTAGPILTFSFSPLHPCWGWDQQQGCICTFTRIWLVSGSLL